MPLNKLKIYPQLLDLGFLNQRARECSLMYIFKRDIEDNPNFTFKRKQIRPIKKEGEYPMQTLFRHLTTCEEKSEDGHKEKRREFEMARSVRLHWIRHHIDELKKTGIDVFSYTDRIEGKDVIRTYVYDIEQEYVVILEPQKSGLDYFLITAYHLNEPGGKKQIVKKQKKKMPNVY